MDELLRDISETIRSDLWNDIVHAPPDQPLMRDACALAAQLKISGEFERLGRCNTDVATWMTR